MRNAKRQTIRAVPMEAKQESKDQKQTRASKQIEAAPLPFPLVAAVALMLISSVMTMPARAAEPAALPELSASGSADDGEYVGPATAYYRWIDSNGTIQYTDFEPVGVPSERISLEPEADDAPMLSSATQDEPSDPFNDQDQQILPIEHIGPCADARRQLAILDAALPVYTDESGTHRNAWRGDTYKGDRRYLDAEARTEAIKVARDEVLAQCSDPEAFAREEAAFQESVQGN